MCRGPGWVGESNRGASGSVGAADGESMESAPDVFLNTDGKRSGLKLFQFAAPVAVEPRRGVRARPAVRTWSARTDSDRTEKVPHGT